jgi:hypothetical protein
LGRDSNGRFGRETFMRKLSIFPVVALIALLAISSPAAAGTKFECEGVETGVTVGDVVVPRDAACTLIDSTVTGNVHVGRNAFFQATGTDIAGKVQSFRSLTVFIDTDSTVGRSVRTDKTTQVFVFNATVGGDIDVNRAKEVAQVCGTTVTSGDVEITRSGPDLLFGDPAAVDCAGNTVSEGDVEIEHNFTDVEFVVRGNTISAGDLEVKHNRGPVEKFVEDNTGGDELECWGNEEPFTATNNTGWRDKEGQCREVLTCETTVTGVTYDDVVVPTDGSCTLTNSTINGNVYVGRNAYFQATNTDIRGKVRGYKSLTVFIDTGSTVGGDVKTDKTAQVFVFNATVGGVDVYRSTQVVQVCGNTVPTGDVEVTRSGVDILIGDPLAVDCDGNTVSEGDIEVERNFTDVEFVIRGNTVSAGDLEVFHNEGPVEKFVEGNIGGDELECWGNKEPFTAGGNTNWVSQEGQCAV